MTLQEALTILKTFHAWRIDDDEVHMQKPSEVTKAIEILLNYHIGDVNKMVMSEIPTDHTKTEQMTSIENFAESIGILYVQFMNGQLNLYDFQLEFNKEYQQSKKMHKQEIIDTFFEGAYGGDNISAEQYYQETFGSKGSDDHICTYEKCPQCLKAQLPQQELIDAEIEQLAKDYILYNDSKRQWVIEGMKLYREQLKHKIV